MSFFNMDDEKIKIRIRLMLIDFFTEKGVDRSLIDYVLEKHEENPINAFNELSELASEPVFIYPEIKEFYEFKKQVEATVASRTLDLHGFNVQGARQLFMRLIENLDRSRPNQLKLCVGVGHNSVEGPKLKPTIEKICEDYGLPAPQEHPSNQGYIILNLPPIISEQTQDL